MGDFRLKSDFLHHHKVRRLRARLGADGVLAWLSLMGYAAENKADGRLSGLSSEDIAIVAEWEGEQDFAGILIELRLLDRHRKTFTLHNWSEWQPWVMASEQRRIKARKAASVRWGKRETQTGTGTSTDLDKSAQSNAPSMYEQCSEHSQSNAPNLTLPNHTQPEEKSSADALLLVGLERKKKIEPYELWFNQSLLPAFPTEGHCQQVVALRFLRKTKPSTNQLAGYLEQVAKWKPVWAEGGWCPGLHSFLSEGKYREAPTSRSEHKNGNGAHGHQKVRSLAEIRAQS